MKGTSSKLDTKGSSSTSYQDNAGSRPNTGASSSNTTSDIQSASDIITTTRAMIGSCSVIDSKTPTHPKTTDRVKPFITHVSDGEMDEHEPSFLGSAKLSYDRQPSAEDEVSVTSSQARSHQQHAVACFEKLTETFENKLQHAGQQLDLLHIGMHRRRSNDEGPMDSSCASSRRFASALSHARHRTRV